MANMQCQLIPMAIIVTDLTAGKSVLQEVFMHAQALCHLVIASCCDGVL